MVGSILKAISILRTFTPEKPILTLNEITSKLEYPKSTVHSMLQTLAHEGFIEKTDKSSYALGRAFIPMTQAILVNAHIRDRAAPLLRELGDFSGESVYLTVRHGYYCLYIYAIESSDRLLARSAVGDLIPMHCTAVGKAILAFLTEDEKEKIFQHVGTPQYTKNTITDRNKLEEDLEITKNRGFSIDNSEHEEGSYCIGAPFFNEEGTVIGSCSVSGSHPSIINKQMQTHSSAVRYVAQEISRRMGFVPRNEKLIWNNINNPLRT